MLTELTQTSGPPPSSLAVTTLPAPGAGIHAVCAPAGRLTSWVAPLNCTASVAAGPL